MFTLFFTKLFIITIIIIIIIIITNAYTFIY